MWEFGESTRYYPGKVLIESTTYRPSRQPECVIVDTSLLVEYKLGDEADRARRIAARLRADGRSGASLKREDIRLLQPLIHRDGFIRTTNLPAGVTLRHYLLFGETPCFNLKPCSESAFEEEFGLTIRAVEELAEKRLVVPAIYVRNPTAWKEAAHLQGIVSEAGESGVTLDAYMALRDPKYDDNVVRQEEYFGNLFDTCDCDQQRLLVSKARVFERSGFVRAMARRWAYIQALEPSEILELEAFFRSHDFEDSVEYLYAAKTIVAGDITEAYGGTFVWGTTDAMICDRVPLSLAGARTDAIRLGRGKIPSSEVLEFVLTNLTESEPFEPLSHVEARHLMTFLHNEENRQVRDELLQAIDGLVAGAIEETISTGSWLGAPDQKLADYRHLLKDYRARLKWLVASVGGGGTAVGTGVGIYLGGYGSLLGALICYGLAKIDGEVARLIAKHFGTRLQRSFVMMDEITRKMHSNE